MNKGEITGIILLDLHKAFDMVDRSQTFAKTIVPVQAQQSCLKLV